MEPFRFKNFSLCHERSAQRIGTDSVLLAAVVPLDGVKWVLDVGSGCGVIGFCIADRLLRAGVDGFCVAGVDIDLASVEEARENAGNFPSQGRCRFQFNHASWQEFVRESRAGGEGKEGYDLIVSNPPYFSHSLKPQDTRRRMARHGDGCLSFEELVEGACRLLSPRGRLFVILPRVEGAEFDTVAQKELMLVSRAEIQPTPEKEVNRIILGYAKARSCGDEKSKICIRNSAGEYTEGYRLLTREFYL